MNVLELFATLNLDSKEYDVGLEKAAGAASGFGGKFASAMKVGGAAIATITTATAALTGAVVNATGKVADYGDHIDKMSQKMGLSAEAYQEWDAVMQHSGTSIDTMQAGMKTLANAVENGNKAFERLGMSQEQVASMSNEELFSATITALQNVEDETERTYLAGQLLGRGATELGALLNTSAEDTEAMKQRVHELGGVMSDEAVKAAAAYKDSLQDMQTAFSGLSRNLLTNFLPSITTVMDGLTEIFSGDSSKGIGMISDGLDSLMSNMMDKLPEFIDVAFGIIDALVTALIDNLPKLIEMGVELAAKLIVGIISHIPQIVASVPKIIAALVNGFTSSFPKIVQVGRDLVNKVGEGIKSLASAAVNWGRDLIQNFINGITSKIQALRDKVSGIANTVKSFLGFSEPEEGPLSNFHTYAPDMMKLFAQGIADNEDIVRDQLSKSFDFGNIGVSAVTSTSTARRDADIIDLIDKRLENIKIYLDTGVLVGAVDDGLQTRKIANARRAMA